MHDTYTMYKGVVQTKRKRGNLPGARGGGGAPRDRDGGEEEIHCAENAYKTYQSLKGAIREDQIGVSPIWQCKGHLNNNSYPWHITDRRVFTAYAVKEVGIGDDECTWDIRHLALLAPSLAT